MSARAAASLLVLMQAPQAEPAGGAPAVVAPDHAARMQQGLELFATRVRALLEANCVKCHGGEATRGQFDLTTRESLLAGGKNGEAIAAGDAASSRLVKLLRHEEKPGMPYKTEPLASADVDAIARWIDLGAPYDKPLGAKTGGEKKPREVTDADRDFWSFRPLVRPPVPAATSWGRTDVDRFVKAQLDERGIAPADAASRRVLARRAWFDLVGLPPPPEEIDAFVADGEPAAWSKLIDRLLASPHFGERWARHWLDVARFAESHGFEHDYDRPNAYTYRDFVIRALNEDLPFDTFVQWQIAGDELAPDDPEAWFATGFLGAGVHATQITMNQVEKERYDELDDIVGTLGTSMLGLSIGCARCHDHKFDPIPTRDYYRMLATFTKTVRSDWDVVLNAAEHREQLARWQGEHNPLVAELERFERDELPKQRDAWIAARVDAAAKQESKELKDRPEWIVLEPDLLASAGSATFTRQSDGSWLASGNKVERDTYTFTTRFAPGAFTALRSLRIEALADPSLAHGGPGRADNGNFALTELAATWSSATTRPAAASSSSAAASSSPLPTVAAPSPSKLRLVNARSTFDQKGLPAAAAIDGNVADDGAAWAVDPEFGKDHAAAFELSEPLDLKSGGELTLTLSFRTNVFHGIGRLRVAASEQTNPELTAAGMPESAFVLLSELERGAAVGDAPERRAALQLLERWVAEHDADWRALSKAVTDHLAAKPAPKTRKALVCSEGLPAIRLHTQGGDFLEQTNFLKRGDPNQKGDVATSAYLQVLMRTPDREQNWQRAPPDGARTPGQRQSLARWLTDVKDGAGNLLARVIVNRLWQHLIGRGLVATPNDFGAMGEKPTHPELLEWLACELVDRGWSLKHVVRLIATSSVYMEGAGGADADGAAMRAADPEDQLCSHHDPHRLEAEAVRDALLDVSGKLDTRMFGPGTLDVAEPRRSIYLFVKRSRIVPMLALFDEPNALSGVGRRQTTTIAPQSLFLMNHAIARAWAEAFAQRVERELAASPPSPSTARTEADFVRRAEALAFGRAPDDGGLADALSFLADDTAALLGENASGDAAFRARVDFCQALMSANEFIYVE